MENKYFTNLFKPNRIVWQTEKPKSETARPESMKNAEDKVKEFQKLFLEKEKIAPYKKEFMQESKAKDFITEKYKDAEAIISKAVVDATSAGLNQREIEEWKKQNVNILKNVEKKYISDINVFAKQYSRVSTENLKKSATQLREIGATEMADYLDTQLKVEGLVKNADDHDFDDYEGADLGDNKYINETRILWRGLQFGLRNSSISQDTVDYVYKTADSKYFGKEDRLLTTADITDIVSSIDSGKDLAEGGKLLNEFDTTDELMKGYITGLLMAAKEKFKSEDVFKNYKKYLKDLAQSSSSEFNEINERMHGGKAEIHRVYWEKELLTKLLLTFKGPGDWEKEQKAVAESEKKEEAVPTKEKKQETMSEGEADLAKMLSKLEENALDLAPVAGDDKYIYAQRKGDEHAELYRSTPEKTSLEEAVVDEDGKLTWKKVDDEALLLAYDIKKIEKTEKPAEVVKSKEEQLAETQIQIAEKTKEMKEAGTTSEEIDKATKELQEKADGLEKEIKAGASGQEFKPISEMVGKTIYAAPEGEVVKGKEGAKIEKPRLSLTDKEKEEIRNKVRAAVKSGNKEEIKKYFEFGADGVVKFNGEDDTEKRKNYLAISLGTMFPNAKEGDKVVVKGREAFFKNGEFFYKNEKGELTKKRAIVKNGYKVQFVKGKGEELAAPEIRKEEEKPKEELHETEQAYITIMKGKLAEEISKRLVSIADTIAKGDYDDAASAINKLVNACTRHHSKDNLGLIAEAAKAAGLDKVENYFAEREKLLSQKFNLSILAGRELTWDNGLSGEQIKSWLTSFYNTRNMDQKKLDEFLTDKFK